MIKKKINSWLVVNTKSGECRVLKKIKPLTNAHEVAINLVLDIEIPEQPVLKAEGKITLSGTQVNNMIIQELSEPGVKEDEV